MSREVLVDETALGLFSEGFLEQLLLHAHLRIHPLEAAVLLGHVRSRFSRTHGVQRSLSAMSDVSIPPNLARHL